MSASDLAAPVLPFFCTCSLASRSASAHAATGPGNLPYQAYHILLNACEVGEGKGRMGLSSLASLSASSHLSAGFHRMFAVLFHLFFHKHLRSGVLSAFFAPVYRAAFRQDDGLLGALFPFLSRQCCFSINWLLGSGALSQNCFCVLVLD